MKRIREIIRKFVAIFAILIFSCFESGIVIAIDESEIDSETENINIINVKECGAKGDGESDDTQAIQRAFNRALNKYKNDSNIKQEIFFPEGTYLVSNTIYVTFSNVDIRGEKDDEEKLLSTIKCMDGEGTIQNQDSVHYGKSYGIFRVEISSKYKYSIKNVAFKDINIDGNKDKRIPELTSEEKDESEQIIDVLDEETVDTEENKDDNGEIIEENKDDNGEIVEENTDDNERTEIAEESEKDNEKQRLKSLRMIALNREWGEWGKGAAGTQTIKYKKTNEDGEQEEVTETIDVGSGDGIGIYRNIVEREVEVEKKDEDGNVLRDEEGNVIKENIKEECTISNINIENCNIYNMPGPSIRIVGKQPNTKVKEEVLSASSENGDISWRNAEEKINNGRYTVNNVTIKDCTLSKSLIGISQNRAKGTEISNNVIYDSLHENLTIDLSDNCKCIGNDLGRYFGGCGSIGTDESDNSIIKNNKIDNTNCEASELWNAGICINSKAGISRNYWIEGNRIIGANYGIFLKDHRKGTIEYYKLKNTKSKTLKYTELGARAGEDIFLIKNVIINNKIYGIRVDEMVGPTYLINNIIDSVYEGKANQQSEDIYKNGYEYKDIYVNEQNKNNIIKLENSMAEYKIGMKIKDIIEYIKSEELIKIYKDDEEVKDTELKISTGMKIKLYIKNETYEGITIVKGDTNGDGEADISDLLKINKHRLNKAFLKDEFIIAGDINKDGKVDIKDILQLNKFRLGKIQSL